MVVTADTAIAEIDEALGHLADVRRTARRCGDGRRDRSLTQRIDYLLEERFARAGQKNSSLSVGAIQCSGPLSPRHRPGEFQAVDQIATEPPRT